MTLEEAIKHAEEVTDKKEREKQKWEKLLEIDCNYRAIITEKVSCELCAEEHKQLAEWLKDYKRLLEQQPCEDAISRQSALNSLIDNTHLDGYDLAEALDAIENKEKLPPVTQIPIECDDAISREDAEQMFRNIRCHLKPQDYKSAEEFNTRDLMLLNAEQMIHALPSVTQKSGRWIYDETLDNWRCSKCNETPKTMGYVGTADFMAKHFKFCNHCGCRMVEPQESEE